MNRTMEDAWAQFKDDVWAEIAEIDARLERREIDEDEWHTAMAKLVVPAHLAARTPWAGSGKSGVACVWDTDLGYASAIRRRELFAHRLSQCDA